MSSPSPLAQQSSTPKQRPRLRVLVIAEACNPEWTSVPLLAYYWYTALKKHVDVTLVTQIRNKPAFMRRGEQEQVAFVDSEALAAPLHKIARIVRGGTATGFGAGSAFALPAYLYFERLVWRRFGDSIRCGAFDLVHRLTPLTPTMPSPIATKLKIPFVVGPLNGNLPWHPATGAIRKQEREWPSWLRAAYRSVPYWRSTYVKASAILLAGRHVANELPRSARSRSVVVPENGVDPSKFFPNPGKKQPRAPFTVLFVGRLVPVKQPIVLVEAVAKLRKANHKVRVQFVGEGPEKSAIRASASRLGVADCIEIVGAVPHAQLREFYCNADVLALPSVHESGGAVLVEAMACGLPCVVTDYGGPAEYVDSELGIRVPLASAPAMTKGFAEAIDALYQNPSQCARMRVACISTVPRKWIWESKARQLLALYQQVLRIASNGKTRV